MEKDLGITRPAFRRRLTQSMLWKLWKMGEEPAAPGALRASDSYCGAVSLRWDGASESNVSFPVHKFVLRRAVLGQRGGGGEVKDWVPVMDGASAGFLDTGLQAGESYRYNLQAWNAIGHSSSVEIDVTVATKGCGPWISWLGGGGAEEEQSLGDLLAALTALAAAALGFRALGGRKRGEAAAAVASLAVTGTMDENGHRGGGGGGAGRQQQRRRPDSLPPAKPAKTAAVSLSSHSEGDSEGQHAGGAGSPVSASSNGGGSWSDKEKSDPRKRPSMLRMATRGQKRTLKRATSEVIPGTTGAGAGGVGTGRSSPLGNGGFREPGRPDAKQHALAAESMRKEAAKRLMPRRSSSREDKEVCRVCRREWRW